MRSDDHNGVHATGLMWLDLGSGILEHGKPAWNNKEKRKEKKRKTLYAPDKLKNFPHQILLSFQVH